MRSSIFICSHLLIVISSILIGCTENSYDVEMLAYDPVADKMVFQVNTVETLTDLHQLEGRATTVLGGLSIELDYQIQEVRWNEEGTTVAFNAVKAGEVYYPEDYHSLAMISIYYGIERSMLFFESLGMKKGQLGGLETYYFADVVSIDEWGDMDTDGSYNNAFYMPIDENDRGFYILPFTFDSGVPLSMNPGVLTHEYTHAVFQELVLDKISGGELYMDPVNYKYLYGLNEGLADVFAVALTGDPDFIRPSISDVSVTRNASDIIKYSAAYDSDAENAGTLFNPYVIGAFVSATLYEISRRLQGLPPDSFGNPDEAYRHLVARAAFNAMFNVGEQDAKYFVPSDFFNEFLAQFNTVQKNIVCQVLSERYAIHYTELEGCL